jgi:hypothetical protein
LPSTHFGGGGIAHVGQGAPTTSAQLKSSQGFCSPRILVSLFLFTEAPQTPGKPHDVVICVQSASVTQSRDVSMIAPIVRRICSHLRLFVCTPRSSRTTAPASGAFAALDALDALAAPASSFVAVTALLGVSLGVEELAREQHTSAKGTSAVVMSTKSGLACFVSTVISFDEIP